MRKNVEILAPAGNLQRAMVAIQKGANAVYIGGKLFSARSGADNFEDHEIEELVKYAKVRGAKVYLAVNTLMKESELNKAINFIEKMYCIGVNAFIFQDIGLATYVKKQLPEVELHASTQLFAHSVSDVKVLKEAGFSRVVLARELSLKEIAEIKSQVDIEIEVFVHGALCVCYSGQCLMSSLIGERSGNRGKCAQSCRLTYGLYDKDGDRQVADGHLLSPKDIMAVEILEDYIKAGVDSLKIEGRMKNEKYVAQIVSGYREKLDNIEKSLNHQTLKDMQQIFNRGGYLIEGYANTYSGPEMMSTETPKSTGLYIGEVLGYSEGKAKIKLNSDVVPGDGIEIWTKIKPNTGTNLGKHSKAGEVIWVTIGGKISKGDKVYKSFDKTLDDKLKGFKETVQKTVKASVYAKLGEPVKLVVSSEEGRVELIGNVVEEASKTPTTKEVVIEKMSKTGGTPYKFEFEEVVVEENLFINIKALNELRREALEKLQSLEEESVTREGSLNEYNAEDSAEGKQSFSVELSDDSYIDEVLNLDIAKVSIPLNHRTVETLEKNVDNIKNSKVELYLKLPKVALNDDEEVINGLLKDVEKHLDLIAGFEVCNYGEYLQVKDYNKKIVGDYNFTVYNTLTKDHLCNNLGFEKVTLSPELNLKELQELADNKSEVVVYGKLEMMVTKQCPVGLYEAKKGDTKYCKLKGKDNRFYLKDRKDVHFDLVTNCDYCNCTVLNGTTLYTIDKWQDIERLNVENYKLVFTTEDKGLVLDVIDAYINVDNDIKEEIGMITNGHFYRGVL